MKKMLQAASGPRVVHESRAPSDAPGFVLTARRQKMAGSGRSRSLNSCLPRASSGFAGKRTMCFLKVFLRIEASQRISRARSKLSVAPKAQSFDIFMHLYESLHMSFP